VATARKQSLAELLEWRRSLAEWQWRPVWEYLEELRRLCAEGAVEVLGCPVLDGLGVSVGDPQPVPATAFDDCQLAQEFGGNHGRLHDRHFLSVWVDLRFPSEMMVIWQAALEAGEVRATKSAGAVGMQLPPPPPQPPTTKGRRGPPKGSGGRRKGTGVYAVEDAPLIKEMHEAIREAKSAGLTLLVTTAAKRVADRAAGGNTTVNGKIARLRRVYTRTYGNLP
jgi:hypothetical protein